MMTRAEILAINRDRLERWGTWLTNQHATALVLIGVGHDHVSGRLRVCQLEDGPADRELALLLRAVADQLEGGGR